MHRCSIGSTVWFEGCRTLASEVPHSSLVALGETACVCQHVAKLAHQTAQRHVVHVCWTFRASLVLPSVPTALPSLACLLARYIARLYRARLSTDLFKTSHINRGV